MEKTNINETYAMTSQNVYRQATAKIDIYDLASDEFPINRGIGLGDPLSPKLFTTIIEETFKKARYL